jgi:DNA mismatch endonuclease Vsr
MAYPHAVDPTVSARLSRQKQKGTRPEIEVAALLRTLGASYRRNVKSLPGSPDFANKSKGWAIFVNGCFWHAHRGCNRAPTPKINSGFWQEKFAKNRLRDAKAIMQLRRQGFRVAIVWECDVREAAPRLARFFQRLR